MVTVPAPRRLPATARPHHIGNDYDINYGIHYILILGDDLDHRHHLEFESGNVVWEENFDQLNTDRWQPEQSSYGDGNGERQCYRPENVTVAEAS